MTDLRVLVADDEPLARRGIRQLLALHPDAAVVGESRDGRSTVRAIETLAPDLVFLDVQMPGMDGFAVLRAVGAERMPDVVFVTAFDQFAVRAFETSAVDYLVKPVGEERFAAALERVRERRRARDAVAVAERLRGLLALRDRAAFRIGEPDAITQPADVGVARMRRLMVPTSRGELVLDVDEIDWIEADDYYAAVHARGRRHLVRMSLAVLEGRLDPARFVRAHRKAIVRLDVVRAIHHTVEGESVLVLRDGTRVPLSRRRREGVTARLRELSR